MSHLVTGLLQGTVDESVFGVHDSRLRIYFLLFHNAPCCSIASLEYDVAIWKCLDESLGVAVIFQHLDSQITSRVAVAHTFVFLHPFLNFGNAILNLMSMVDVDMAEGRVVALTAFIHLDDGMKEVFYASACLEYRWHHWNTKQLTQLLVVYFVTSLLRFIKHVESTHHAQVHVDELGCQIEVALQVRGVYDVDHHVGCLLDNLFSHVKFLGRVGRKGVSAGQVNEVELVALELGVAFLGIDGDARVVAHALVSSAGKVEE